MKPVYGETRTGTCIALGPLHPDVRMKVVHEQIDGTRTVGRHGRWPPLPNDSLPERSRGTHDLQRLVRSSCRARTNTLQSSANSAISISPTAAVVIALS